MNVLDELWQEGHEFLDVYYLEEISQGEEEWWVDVYQDEINEHCHLNWTWTIISKRQLEIDGEKESGLRKRSSTIRGFMVPLSLMGTPID